MLNVGHVPEDHGQVGKAEIQQLQKTEPLNNDNSGAYIYIFVLFMSLCLVMVTVPV